MIKFFRKIRQKLLSENRFSKYLLYAIGEIVLVVIGILIAINLNNSNERATLKRKINTQYNLLKQSIYQDSISFQYLINYNKTQLENAKNLLLQLNEPEIEENCIDFINKFNNIIEIRTNIVDRSIFDEMVSTGAFSQIEQSELKTKISNYYHLSDHFNNVNSIHVKDFREFKNKIASDGIIARIYFDTDKSIDEKVRCAYIKSLIQDDEKKKLIENYIYSSIDTYEQITELYSVLLNNVMKGIPKIEK